jgi:hypothetical protein
MYGRVIFKRMDDVINVLSCWDKIYACKFLQFIFVGMSLSHYYFH